MNPAPAPRVLQLTLRDLVGQRFNGYRLHRALRAEGWDSRMLVVHRRSGEPEVRDHGRLGVLLERGLYAAERMTGLQGMLSPFGIGPALGRAVRAADVVHWQLIYPHYIGLPAMPRLARLRPTAWTLHDPWALTGHCVHPLECGRWLTGCGRCPDLARNFAVWHDTTAFVWRTKQAAYARAPFTVVVSSRWMRERVAASPLLAGHDCRVIPFGLDLATWAPPDRAACRARLGLPQDARVIAFRMPAGARHRLAKGVPWLLEALARLPAGAATHLLALDDRGQLEPLRGRFDVIETGWVDDERQVADALAAADVFVMPSLAESFGMMALESMACGTPVVISEGTAMTEVVRPPEAGLAAPPRDAAALAAALERLLGDAGLRRAMGAAGQAVVRTEYSFERYRREHEQLYRELAQRRAALVGR